MHRFKDESAWPPRQLSLFKSDLHPSYLKTSDVILLGEHTAFIQPHAPTTAPCRLHPDRRQINVLPHKILKAQTWHLFSHSLSQLSQLESGRKPRGESTCML